MKAVRRPTQDERSLPTDRGAEGGRRSAAAGEQQNLRVSLMAAASSLFLHLTEPHQEPAPSVPYVQNERRHFLSHVKRASVRRTCVSEACGWSAALMSSQISHLPPNWALTSL